MTHASSTLHSTLLYVCTFHQTFRNTVMCHTSKFLACSQSLIRHSIQILDEVYVYSQERQKVETGEFSLEAKCASCWDAQTPFLRVHSLPVTLRMKNNSSALPGFLKIRITIDKIFKDQDGIQNIQSLAEAPHKHLSPSLLHCKLERTSCET